MDIRDQFGSAAGRPDDETVGLAAAVPRSLALLLAQLAHLSPHGRSLVLETVGPGSRLVLEALRLVERDEPRLTDLGVRVAELLAGVDAAQEQSGGVVVPFRPRIRRIARVVSTQSAAAAATGDAGERERYISEYRLVPDQPESGTTPRAAIEVARMGDRLRLWQIPEHGSDTVVHLETMDPLPLIGDEALILTNSDNEPPSKVLRRVLALADEDGEGTGGG